MYKRQILKYLARSPGCSNGDIKGHVKSVSPNTAEQVGGYLKILIDRYRMIEKRLPIFAKPNARRGRYYIRDNFLRAWLSSLANPASAINFRPERLLVDAANARPLEAEGHGLERLVGALYQERSRKGLPGFALTHQIEGYWDRSDTEIDLVAINVVDEVIRFGTCKRSQTKMVSDLDKYDGHIQRFLNAHGKYNSWTIEKVAIAPKIDDQTRQQIRAKGYEPQDLTDLTKDL